MRKPWRCPHCQSQNLVEISTDCKVFTIVGLDEQGQLEYGQIIDVQTPDKSPAGFRCADCRRLLDDEQNRPITTRAELLTLLRRLARKQEG